MTAIQNKIIPSQLEGWHFITIKPGLKTPTGNMSGWAENREKICYKIDSPELIKHIKEGGNYGVTSDIDRFILASDNKEVELVIENSLPPTFTVQSPRHKTKHFYYYGKLTKNLNYKTNPEGDPCLDVRKGNMYVLGAGSIFSEYGDYKVIDDRPIATTTEEAVIEATKHYFKSPPKPEQTKISYPTNANEISFPISNLPIKLSGKRSGQEILTSHPIHGSTTNANFSYNASKNTWHCFRHNTGGSSLELLAIMEGIISCEESIRGCLKGELFHKIIEIAIEKGYLPKDVLNPSLNELAGVKHQTIYKEGVGRKISFFNNNEINEKKEKNLPTPTQDIVCNTLTKDELLKALSFTIKGDDTNKEILFRLALLNYTKDSQQNIALCGSSSTGKTYLSNAVMEYFPKEDILMLGSVSPRAFFYDQGVLVDTETGEPIIDRETFIELRLKKWLIENPEPIKTKKSDESKNDNEIGKKKWELLRDTFKRDNKNLWNKTPKHIRIILEKKFLVLLEMPSYELLKQTRSLLSHDRKSIFIKTTDKNSSGQHATKNIEIVGFPTLIYNSVELSTNEQEQTRLWLLSPEKSQKKLNLTIPFIFEKEGNPQKFIDDLNKKELRIQLVNHIQNIKNKGINEIIIGESDLEIIKNKFIYEHHYLTPRLQRDVKRLIDLIKSHTLFNYQERTIDKNNNLYVNKEDIDNGYNLYKLVCEPNELGIPPYIFEIYNDVIFPKIRYGLGMNARDLQKAYLMKYHTTLGSGKLQKIIELLDITGLIVFETDPTDNRKKMMYHPNPEQPTKENQSKLD